MTKANLTWLTDDLATGGDLSYSASKAAAQVLDIQAQQVTHIVDLRVEANDHNVWEGTGVTYTWLPVHDAHGYHIPHAVFDAVVEAARVAQAAGGKVLAHCHMGINRGPSAAYAILLDRGMDAIEAFDLIREKRPITGIAFALDALDAHCARRNASDREWQQAKHAELALHISKVMNMETVQHIQRAIAVGHRNDAAEWREAQAS